MEQLGTVEGREVIDDRYTARTLCDAFQRTAHEYAAATALRTPGNAVELTWADVAERVERLSAGLAALGIARGDTVAMMLRNRPEFHLLDWAALHLGATPFSMYVTSPPEQIAHLLDNADSRVIVTERAFLDAVAAAVEMAGANAEVVVVDSAEGFRSLDDLLELGADDFAFEATWRAVEPGDVACLIYTSGTTGPPKGVQLTHHNLIAAWRAACASTPVLNRTGRFVSYLPHAHMADRIASHYPAMLTGSSVTCVDDPKAILAALPDLRPTYFLAVPRIWEKLKPALEPKLGVDATIAEALERGRLRARGETLDASQEAAYDAVEAAVFAPLRSVLGLDAADVLVSGAAPIAAEVLEFFAAIGLEITEGYGMSETSAVATATRQGALRFGTVGPPLPGIDVRLAEDGEVLVHGDVVMLGYRKQPEQTAEAIDADGWLHTGDLGAFDDEGNLRIVDRKKELIINASGKNMSPANIETAIRSASSLVGHVVAIGDKRPYNVALIVPDPEVRRTFDGEQAVREEIDRALAEGNARLSRIEQIKRYALVDDEWLPGGEELTPTLKLKRRSIRERYEGVIEQLYQADGRDG